METSIWRNVNFVKFFSSTTIGNLGDWFDLFALQLIFAHEFHASALMLGALFAVYCAPGLLFSNFSGVIADRFNPQKLLLGTDFICGAITIGLALSSSMIMALLLILLRGFFANVNAPAQQTTLKALVHDDHLLQASAYNGISFQLCQVIGPFIGAILVAFFNPRLCIGINAASFFVSCLILFSLRVPSMKKPLQNKTEKFWKDIAEAWTVITHTPTLRTVMTLFFLCFLAAMVGMTQSVILLKTLYPAQQNLLGYMMAAGAIGSTLGGVYLSSRKQLKSYLPPMASGLLMMSLSYLIISHFQPSWSALWLYLLSAFGGIGIGLMMVVYSYALKKEPAAHLVGRVYSAGLTIQSAIIIVGSLGMGLLTHWIGIYDAFLVASILCGVAFLLALLMQKSLKASIN